MLAVKFRWKVFEWAILGGNCHCHYFGHIGLGWMSQTRLGTNVNNNVLIPPN